MGWDYHCYCYFLLTMTAQSFAVNVKAASTFSTCRAEGEAAQKLNAAALATLGGLTATDSVRDALEALSTCVAEGNKVTNRSIGLATSVLY